MTTAASQLENAIRAAAFESRRLYLGEFNEAPDEATIGDWDTEAWTEDLRNAQIEAGVEEVEEDEYAALLEAWRAVFFATKITLAEFAERNPFVVVQIHHFLGDPSEAFVLGLDHPEEVDDLFGAIGGRGEWSWDGERNGLGKAVSNVIARVDPEAWTAEVKDYFDGRVLPRKLLEKGRVELLWSTARR